MRLRTLFVGLSVLSLSLVAPAARGAPAESKATTEQKAAARALAVKAWELYEAGKYTEAIEQFQKAEKTFHAPTLVWGAAKACLKSGRLLEARALFQRVVNEKIPDNASVEFRGAQQTSKEALADLEPRIPTVQISVRGAAGRPVALKIDGALSPAELDKPVAMDPGPHQIAAVPEGGDAVAKNLDLKEGAHERVEIDLTPTPAPAPLVSVKKKIDTPPPKRGSVAPAVISFSLGAIGAGAGVVTGLETLNRTKAIKSRCMGVHCLTTDAAAGSTAKTFGILSTVGFAVAGAGIVTGVTLLAVRSKPKAPSAASLDLVLGPGTLGATGAF